MTVEIVNPVALDEFEPWVRSLAATFLEDPEGPEMAVGLARHRENWDPDRAWGAREHDRWVATLCTESRRLTLPGSGIDTVDVEVDALTAVTVAATHRRRGLLRTMLTAALRDARDRGDAWSILIAAEWGIYRRFGYAPATFSAEYTLQRARRGSEIVGDPGRIRQLERDAFAELAPRAFAAARRRRAGQVDRDGDWWPRTLGAGGRPRPAHAPHNFLVHDGPDGPDGLLTWRAEAESGLLPPLGTVAASLFAAGPTAERNLWAYLTGLDGVDRVTLGHRPLDDPARWWLADGRTLTLAEPVDFLWLKLLDVPAALAARGYAAPGELVIEVTGAAEAVDVAGRYRLTAEGSEAACAPTRAPADLAIDQRALASVYLGGYRLHELLAAGLAEEITPGAAARASTMFATPLAPWNATGF